MCWALYKEKPPLPMAGEGACRPDFSNDTLGDYEDTPVHAPSIGPRDSRVVSRTPRSHIARRESQTALVILAWVAATSASASLSNSRRRPGASA